MENDISNGNRTEWSPSRSVIIRVIAKSDVFNHEYDYRPNWTTQSLITNYIIIEKNGQIMKEKENSHENTCKGDVNILR